MDKNIKYTLWYSYPNYGIKVWSVEDKDKMLEWRVEQNIAGVQTVECIPPGPHALDRISNVLAEWFKG